MSAGLAGMKALSMYLRFCVAPYSSSCLRNSASRALKLALSLTSSTMFPTSPLFDPGHSQSMSMPSKTPAAAPGPPRPSNTGRLPLMYRSMQLETSFSRDSFVAAAAEKFLDQVQPPMEIMTFSWGCLALSCLSWLNEPARGWSQESATPETDVAAV